ncbi:cobaltochelatase subunit CobN [Methanothermobacter marburgensis]|uniref:Predicted cobalamin biosynthesis protein N n=1 Tax=Methanothermobacter marburgensis (strain ATCC BAA-927 / DSM 2133 / JCM 14651 / NBRC 100331 / OCM 82 / Marburg) TaxID=79929 RepID=D9PWA1_METTM|nr:cobaltochelatase subunit CobN [Methanothermobacter marburgensis]ADL58499.1 predicted cobalamin biosynthesis protein N [Methanothermobacter marburgensis str. Marburg]WBF09103.1 cobaltochelatase subunit CobN [Methanothermobacter marburgensis]
MAVILAVALTGTASAAEVSGHIKEIYNETSGGYTTLQDALPVKNATITVIYNGSVINETRTAADGSYRVTFSDTFPVEVRISYHTYRPVTYTVTASRTLNHTFMPDIAIISSVPEKGRILESMGNRRIIYHDMWDPSSAASDWIMEYVNFAYLDMAMPGTGWGDSWYPYLLRSPANQRNMIAAAFGYPTDTDTDPYGGTGLNLLGGTPGNDTPDTVENTYIASYYALASGGAARENLENMIKYIQYLLGETTFNPVENNQGPVMAAPDWGLYHPDLGVMSVVAERSRIKAWIEGNPGLIPPYDSLRWIDQNFSAWAEDQRADIYRQFENWYTANKNMTGPFIVVVSYNPSPTVDAIIRQAEKEGRAIFNLYQGATNPAVSSLLEELALGVNGKGPLTRRIDAVISLYSWSLNYANLPSGGAVAEFERINIPVIKGVQLYSNSSLTNPLGAQYEWTWQVTIPGFEGVFSPIVVSYTDASWNEVVVQPGVEKIVKLADAWARLRELSNADKKIAVILYSYPPGKDGFTASYLDVFRSLHDLLVKLNETGYRVERIPDVEELYRIVSEFGNKGTWAQPLLERYVSEHRAELQASGQLLDVQKYLEWFSKLPEKLRSEVISKWGTAPGNIMTVNGSIVIPGIMLGNIFVTVQPARGWDEVTDYHNPYLPPHHQYIAFYRWLENVFMANAMIHLGTHGTLEFLPGRMIGLMEDDWPFQLTGIPNIYPYIVSNPGEGMVAKDRSGALIIDHMTPAMVESGLYGKLIEIHDLIHQYENALKVGNSQILPALESQIRSRASEMGFNMSGNFTDALERLHLSLHEIESDIIPLGLHSLGRVLEGEELVEEVLTIASSRSEFLENIRKTIYPSKPAYTEMLKDPLRYSDEIASVKNLARTWIRNIINGTAPAGINGTDLEFINETIRKIRGNTEWQSLLSALGGGFVRPGLAGDPAWCDVLPTGANFYATNPKKMPTKAAWETAKRITDTLLAEYYMKHGKFPELVGMVMWGTELLRTDGVAIAEFMYLLGVKPQWNTNGDVKPEPVLMDASELKITVNGVEIPRPRIDVFVTAVTGNQLWIDLMNAAVKMAAEANDTENYVKRHYSECGSLDRVFGLRGLVLEGTGVSDMTPATSRWNTSAELADVYLSRVSYAWRSTPGGVDIQQNRGTFQYLLGKVNLVTQNLDSTWRLIDTDDYYDWFGGMVLASRHLGGNPDTALVDIRNRNTVTVRTVAEEIELEVRSQLLNPRYMDSLLSSPSGWLEYASRYKNVFGVAVTTGAVSNELWNQLAVNLLSDRFRASRDYEAVATQSMIAWVLEAARRNIWNADKAVLRNLANRYIELAGQYGVVCCHHTCANIVFNNWVVKVSSVNQASLKRFAAALAAATGASVNVPQEGGSENPDHSGSDSNGESAGMTGQRPSGSSGESYSGSSGSAAESQSSATPGETEKGAESGKAYEVSASTQSGSSETQVPLYALLGVVALVFLVGFGYWRGR